MPTGTNENENIQDYKEQRYRNNEVPEHGRASSTPLHTRLQTGLETVSEGICGVDAAGNITFVNPAAVRLLGYGAEELIGQPVHDLTHWSGDDRSDDTAQHAEGVRASRDCPLCRAAQTGTEHYGLRANLKRKDGTVFPVYCNVAPMVPEGAEPEAVITFCDITRHRQAQSWGRRLQTIVDETPVFISTADRDGNITYLNKTARAWLGLSADDDIDGWKLAETSEKLRVLAAETGMWQGEREDFLAQRLGTDEGRAVLQTIVAHKGDDGTVEFYSTIAVDISERKRIEEWLLYLATHDPLTGAMNRSRFHKEMEEAFVSPDGGEKGDDAEPAPGALLYLDLDNFKDVNDSLGHRAGDEILVRIAQLLRANLRDQDKFARLGGDEFAILLPDTNPVDARAIAQRLLRVLEEDVIVYDGRPIRVRASIGLATYPEHADNLEDLLVHADLSMYEAKRDGGHRIVVCSSGEAGRRQARSRLWWEHKCAEALRNDEFILYWQPLKNLQTGRVEAYELLLRMDDGRGGVILPGEFLSVCERSELITDIDRWVLRRAIGYLTDPAAEKEEAYRLHVNLSGRTISDPGWLTFVRDEVQSSGVDPSRLVLEITETAAIENVHRGAGIMQLAREMGLRFALDDFGVGFSSLHALRKLPVDYLKIDGSFIQGLPTDGVNQHLVKAFVEIARGLGIETVAEFVEDEATVQLLKQYGIDYGQGYHIGRPAPREQL